MARSRRLMGGSRVKILYSNKKGKQDMIMVGFVVAFILIVAALVYFNTGSRVAVTGIIAEEGFDNLVVENQTIEAPKEELKKYIPLELKEDDILISFRIDDLSFRKSEKQIFENALYLGRKYNVTFDIATIAKRFEEQGDKEIFNIYNKNKDIFEVVAHGLTHADYQNNSCSSRTCFINTSCGEFKCASYEQQEQHISEMKDIFEENNLDWATKIFLLPWQAGDDITIELAEKYGYLLMTQSYTPDKSVEYKSGNLIVSKAFAGVPMNQTLSNEEIEKAIERTNDLIKNNQKNIQIVMHPINFREIENSEELLKKFVALSKENPKIKFGFIWEGLER